MVKQERYKEVMNLKEEREKGRVRKERLKSESTEVLKEKAKERENVLSVMKRGKNRKGKKGRK